MGRVSLAVAGSSVEVWGSNFFLLEDNPLSVDLQIDSKMLRIPLDSTESSDDGLAGKITS